MTETRRKAFEAYFLDSRKSKRKPNFARLPDGTYADDHTQRHWWTWQKALASLDEAPQQLQGQAALYASRVQLEALNAGLLPGCQTMDDVSGVYLPVRPVAGGKFTIPLYARPQAAQPSRVVDAPSQQAGGVA